MPSAISQFEVVTFSFAPAHSNVWASPPFGVMVSTISSETLYVPVVPPIAQVPSSLKSHHTWLRYSYAPTIAFGSGGVCEQEERSAAQRSRHVKNTGTVFFILFILSPLLGRLILTLSGLRPITKPNFTDFYGKCQRGFINNLKNFVQNR